MTLSKPLRILHAPLVIAGNSLRLAEAERDLGYDSISVEIGTNSFGYKPDERIEGGLLAIEVKRVYLLLRAILKFDIVHFNFGESFFPRKYYPSDGSGTTWKQSLFNRYAGAVEMKDVWLLSKFRKKIYVTFQGDDLRSPDLLNPSKLTLSSGTYSEKKNLNNLMRAELWCKYAHGIYYLNPDLKQYLPGKSEFLPYSSVNIKANAHKAKTRIRNRPIVLFHAPSSRDVKGTSSIISAVNLMKEKGMDVRLDVVENVSNDEVLSRLSNCDYVIDQLLAGWYGGFAVEAMSLKKPVVAWLDSRYFDNVPKDLLDDLPVINADADSLVETLSVLIDESDEDYEKRCNDSIGFVTKWHDPIVVAKQTTTRYQL